MSGSRPDLEEEVIKLAAVAFVVSLAAPIGAAAQVVGTGADKARPVQGDPGISSQVLLDTPDYRVLRDYAEPGATRRMHAHKDATYHVFTLVTGTLRVTIEGQQPVEVKAGDVLQLQGGASHTFTNIGKVAATIVEVFGKAPGGTAPAAAPAPR